jgi:hypothetical protein
VQGSVRSLTPQGFHHFPKVLNFCPFGLTFIGKITILIKTDFMHNLGASPLQFVSILAYMLPQSDASIMAMSGF